MRSLDRLDAWYFLSPGAAARRRLEAAKEAGVETRRVAGNEGLGLVWAPARFKRAYAAPGEPSVPYLAPHDIFEYLPDATVELSLSRTKKLDDYRVKRGTVLQTCSGRNLGPSVIVDSYLAGFVMSHDLVRVEIEDETLRFYTVGFLQSRTGQGLLRRDKSGSVIDHITADHVAAQEVPLLEPDVRREIASDIRNAFALVEEARTELRAALSGYLERLPGLERVSPLKHGWTTRAADFDGRLDAAPHSPTVRRIRLELLESGGVRLGDVARVLKPGERYKTKYVTASYGRPLLSGTQVLQRVLVKPQYMAESAFRDPKAYELKPGWSVYMADGRAEKGLGVVALVTPEREGWLASGHVGRLIPHDDTNPGWLWLAARTPHAQLQIKALASGSVVDSTFPDDMESVILPSAEGIVGDRVQQSWVKFSKADALESKARNRIDAELARVSGVMEEPDEPEAGVSSSPEDDADED